MSWIEERIEDLRRLNGTIQSEFGEMEVSVMDRKPAPDRWSANECFDHLIQTNRQYYDILDAIAQGEYRPQILSRLPFFPRLLGKTVLRIVSPDYKGRGKTAKIFFPSQSNFGRNLAPELISENEVLIDKFQRCPENGLDRILISSPVTSLVAYNLRECIRLLVTHEQRHVQQALHLKPGVDRVAPRS